MERQFKRELRRLWRVRVFAGAGAALLLGTSVLQVRNVFKHRAEQSPWVLELSEAVEEAITTRGGAQRRALDRAFSIAKQRNLVTTQNVTLDRELALTLYLYLDLHAAKFLAPRALALDLDLDLDLDRAQALDLDLDRVLDWPSAKALDLSLRLIWTHDGNLFLSHDQNLFLSQNRNLDLDLKLNLDLDLVVNQARNPYFMFLINTELEEKYGLKLHQGEELERLINQESNRAQALLQAQIFLGLSVLAMLATLLVLFRLQGPSGIPPNAHLIAFLPEECVAEIVYLSRRLKKQKASIWKIRMRMAEEFFTLLWAFYVQARIDNLFLPHGDHRVDDD